MDDSVSLSDLRAEVHSLWSLLNGTVLAVLLLSVGVNAYLYYQDRIVRAELGASKKMVQDFESTKGPLISKFVSSLQGFAQHHPDFNPILDKYGIRAGALAGAAAPGTSPAKAVK
jgi:hypothetical protein